MYRVEGWKKMHHANTIQKKTGVVLLIQNKVDFRDKNIKVYFIMFPEYRGLFHNGSQFIKTT